MASEQLQPEKSKTQKRARATTMLVHELPTSTEIYESFVWDPDDELIFESSSSSENTESEIDFSFLFEDSTSGEDVDAVVDVPSDDIGIPIAADDESLSSSSYTTPGWNETIKADTQLADNAQTASQPPAPTTPHLKSEESQSEPHVQNAFRRPVARTPHKAQSVQFQSSPRPKTSETQNDPKIEDHISDDNNKTIETGADGDMKQDDTNKDETQMTDPEEAITSTPTTAIRITDAIIKDNDTTQNDTSDTVNTNNNAPKVIKQQLLSPMDIANQLTEEEQRSDEASYKPVVICVTQFKRKKKRKKDKRNRGGQGSKLSVKRRERIIRRHSRAVKGTIPCPKIADQVMSEPDGSVTVTPVRLVHLFVRARSHPKLNSYKNMNYASKSYQLAPELVVDAWDKEADVRGDFTIGDRVFAFVKKNLRMQKEYKMAVRTNTNEIKHAILLLNFIESKLDESLQNVKKISKFNHDACIQSIIAEMNK